MKAPDKEIISRNFTSWLLCWQLSFLLFKWIVIFFIRSSVTNQRWFWKIKAYIEAMGPIYFVFCRLYPSSPQPPRQFVWILPVISLLLTNNVSTVRACPSLWACLFIWLERFLGEPKGRSVQASYETLKKSVGLFFKTKSCTVFYPYRRPRLRWHKTPQLSVSGSVCVRWWKLECERGVGVTLIAWSYSESSRRSLLVSPH